MFQAFQRARKKAVALVKELGNRELIQPTFVIIEHRNPDNYQLKIKGNYNLQEIGVLLKTRFSMEENKNYLIISSL